MDWSLIKEMKDWSNDWSKQQKGSKALRVYNKCMLTGRIKVSKRIEDKYGEDFPQSDIAISLALALINLKKK